MPNPLVQFGQHIGGKKPPRHPGVAGVKPEADTPESEEYYEGQNQAWRGTELHGVPTEHNSKAVEYGNHNAENADVVTKYAEPPNLADPVPVVVVNEYSREQRRFRTAQFSLRDRAQQIVGAHERRSSVRIRNMETVNKVFVGTDASMSVIVGYRLDPGQELSLKTETEVFAMCNIGETALLSILDEYSVEIP